MKTFRISKPLALMLAVVAVVMPLRTLADDTDIFVGSSGGTAANPNVLIILDNTSNWSSNNQGWLPSGTKQGESELLAIKAVVGTLGSNVNVGLMMFTDNGSGREGAYVRYAVRQMTATNKTAFQTKLQTILDNFNGVEKTASNANYGNVLFEAFKYFGGYTSPAHLVDGVAGTPTDATHFGPLVLNQAPVSDYVGSSPYNAANPYADAGGYTAGGWTTYNPPISTANSCAKNYIIFIGNGYPNADTASLLSGVGGDVTIINSGEKKNDRYGNEWTRFLFQTDVSSAPGLQNVSTYTIDVFKDKPDAEQGLLLRSMAKVGGGKYFTATSYQAIVDDLVTIFDEIQAVNSVFSAVSLPANVTNRAINDNQVFIAMFRPDPAAQPRWFGNAKQYKLIKVGNNLDLGDANNIEAINPATGFMTSCAASVFTTDSGTYWQNTTYNPRPAGTCPTTANSPYSDSPDGSFVEKGGIAEVIRRGNSAATNTTPTWAVNRTLYTQVGNALATPLTTTNTGLAQSLVDFISGKDTGDENQNSNLTETRPSLHGDVIHSRPMPINYGGSTGTVLYYGSNDGTLRAAEVTKTTGSGRELWAFFAPEFFTARTHTEATPSSFNPMQRLQDNTPLVRYPDATTPPASAAKRDYFFDGPIGAYQATTGSPLTTWIYPTMRRGGRMVYSLDVTTPTTPAFKWKAGCPNLHNDTGCTTNMAAIGQTWSLPKIVRVKGYSTTARVAIFGGGYDACEDADSATPSCGSTKGNRVFVLDADTGAFIASFNTTRSVAADVAIIDLDSDTMVDHAYVVDTGGSLYRIDFVNPSDKAVRASNAWTITKVAETAGAGRKFLYEPSLYAKQGKVYAAFGSGDREHPLQSQYPFVGPVVNRFYVYVDDAAATPSSVTNLDDTTVLANYTSSTTCDTPKIEPTSTLKGWFMDLTAYGTGEQTVTSSLIVGDLIVFSTNRPIPMASGTCATPLGEARGYWVNLYNASGAVGTNALCGGTSRSGVFTGGGLVGSPVLVNVSVPDDANPTEAVFGASQRDGGASSPFRPQLPPTGGFSSMRKIIYWNTSNDN